MNTTASPITWADEHPEVAANNARDTIPWPCEKIETDLDHCHQPCIVANSSGELYAEGNEGKIFHSLDNGHTWSQLCRVPPLFDVPDGMELISAILLNGIGVAPSGALLGCWWCAYSANSKSPTWETTRGVEDTTLDYALCVTRSEDRGRTWSASAPFDAPPHEKVGGGKMRVAQMSNGRLLIQSSSSLQSRPDRPVARVQHVSHGHIFASTDDGRTWSREGFIGDNTHESDLLQLPSGRILASVRYQRMKKPEDPPQFVSPYDGSTKLGSHSVYKNMAFAFSDDGGVSWSPPRIVTGFGEKTGCLIRLSDGTLLMPYSRKDGTHGQRFIASYDEGQTWSNAIFQLNDFGLFASTVALEDDTLVTVHETRRGAMPNNRTGLHVLRWKAPKRSEVEKHGFFEPRLAQ